MIVQPAQLMVVRRLVCIAGRAVATIVVSIELMNNPTATIAKISRRDDPGAPGDGACSPAGCSIATIVSLPNEYDPASTAPADRAARTVRLRAFAHIGGHGIRSNIFNSSHAGMALGSLFTAFPADSQVSGIASQSVMLSVPERGEGFPNSL